MVQPGSHITATTAGHVLIRLIGTLDEATAIEAVESISRRVLASPEEMPVMIDMAELEGCQILARAQLIELQSQIRDAGRRSAWVSSRSRFRGLALLICHGAEDPNATVVTSQEQAKEWFASDEVRIDAAKRVVERLQSIKHARGAGDNPR